MSYHKHVVVVVSASSARISHHREILNKILAGNFTPLMRPVVEDNKATQVSIKLTLTQIRDLVSETITVAMPYVVSLDCVLNPCVCVHACVRLCIHYYIAIRSRQNM